MDAKLDYKRITLRFVNNIRAEILHLTIHGISPYPSTTWNADRPIGDYSAPKSISCCTAKQQLSQSGRHVISIQSAIFHAGCLFLVYVNYITICLDDFFSA